MKRNILSENMRRFGTKNLNEQSEPRDPKSKIMPIMGQESTGWTVEFRKGIQCFLNTAGYRDNQDKQLEVDGKIGNYPHSKTAQAIFNAQEALNARNKDPESGKNPKLIYPIDGKWGQDTYDALSAEEKKIFHDCIEQYQGGFMNTIKTWFSL